MDPDVLTQENERLRQLNARLRSALDEVQARLTEPEEIIRAIRHGEIDALVVQEQGEEEIYSLQHYDSVYRSMVEQCFPFGVWLAEPDGRLLYVSPKFLELVRTDLATMRRQGQFHFLPAQVRAAVEREWARCRETGEPLDVEYSVRFGDGPDRAIWTRGVLAPAHGSQKHWVGVNIDVTERREIRDEMERQAETLRRQADALREADRRKDEFLALLGHELRNPLATISNGLHVLLRPDVEPGDRRQIQEMMANQVHHLTRLVDDLLDVNRITRGQIQLRKQRVDVRDAVHRAIDSVRPLIDAQGHELTVLLAPGALQVEADPTRLEQVLVNLLNNAAKYTRPGGRISLTAEREGGLAAIRVRDSGVGIPVELLPKVFDLFTQVEGSLDRSQGGLGIGLTLVKELVEMHGGRVEARSEGADRGSEFVVRLPALDATADDRKAPGPPAAAAEGRKLRILVVDDSRDVAQSTRILLELSGHDVWVARDGPEALAAFRSYKPDVVLLDVGLPGMSGYDVARRLRAGGEADATLVVAVSGYGQEEDVQRALEAGCDLHMTKPVDSIRLGAVLASRSASTAGRQEPAGSAARGSEP